MPISSQDAMNKVFSLELKGDEIIWFERLCLYTDYYIDKKFNGEYVEISFENMFIPTMPTWRQDIVLKVWLKTYNKIGWSITEITKQYTSKRYKFEPNLRQMKLERILDKPDV